MIEKTFKLRKSYTQTTCLQLCYQDFLQSKYQCYNPFLPYLPDLEYPPCPSIIDSLNNTIFYDKESYYAENADQECFESCPVECLYITYETTVSSSQFPTVTYSEVLSYNENVTRNFESYRGEKQFSMIESSVLSVNVFYKTDLYTRITEKPTIEWEKFLSNLGN
jgi:NAD-dependent dihydropyrimidine dehydrogenase PreA subunit